MSDNGCLLIKVGGLLSWGARYEQNSPGTTNIDHDISNLIEDHPLRKHLWGDVSSILNPQVAKGITTTHPQFYFQKKPSTISNQIYLNPRLWYHQMPSLKDSSVPQVKNETFLLPWPPLNPIPFLKFTTWRLALASQLQVLFQVPNYDGVTDKWLAMYTLEDVRDLKRSGKSSWNWQWWCNPPKRGSE